MYPAGLRRLLALLLLGVWTTGCGIFSSESQEDGPDGGPVWREASVRLPPFPREQDLVQLPPDLIPSSNHRYFVDLNSVSRGRDDVVRYTAVVRSGSGSENVYYEGIRCSEGEFKGYGFGASHGRLEAVRNGRWRPFAYRGPTSFRSVLAERYICGRERWPLEREEIVSRLRRPAWATRENHEDVGPRK